MAGIAAAPRCNLGSRARTRGGQEEFLPACKERGTMSDRSPEPHPHSVSHSRCLHFSTGLPRPSTVSPQSDCVRLRTESQLADSQPRSARQRRSTLLQPVPSLSFHVNCAPLFYIKSARHNKPTARPAGVGEIMTVTSAARRI